MSSYIRKHDNARASYDDRMKPEERLRRTLAWAEKRLAAEVRAGAWGARTRIADAIGLSGPFVSNIVNGKARLGQDGLAKLAAYWGYKTQAEMESAALDETSAPLEDATPDEYPARARAAAHALAIGVPQAAIDATRARYYAGAARRSETWWMRQFLNDADILAATDEPTDEDVALPPRKRKVR